MVGLVKAKEKTLYHRQILQRTTQISARLVFCNPVLFYPLLVLSAIFYDWRLALGLFALPRGGAGFIFYRTMKNLDEKDLWPWFFFWISGCFSTTSFLHLHSGKKKTG
jgi:hypothetical protein